MERPDPDDLVSGNTGTVSLNIVDSSAIVDFAIVDLSSNALVSVTPTGSHESYNLLAADGSSSNGILSSGITVSAVMLLSLLVFRRHAFR